jgi:hypothetical protein
MIIQCCQLETLIIFYPFTNVSCMRQQKCLHINSIDGGDVGWGENVQIGMYYFYMERHFIWT